MRRTPFSPSSPNGRKGHEFPEGRCRFRYRVTVKNRSRSRWAGKLAALWCVALLAACGGGDTTDGEDSPGSVEVSKDPVLLPADAAAIVADLNAGSDKANETIDAQLQNAIETSPARDIDDANFKRLKALGRTTASSASPRTLQDVKVYVPRQTTYPARFMAHVKLIRADNPATTRLRLYEKEAADEPWKLAMYITVPAEFAAPDVPVDADGFAQLVEGPEGLKLDPSKVSEELANYLSGYATGTDSSIFAPGRHTSELSQSYKDSNQENAQATITSSTAVEPGELPVQAFKTADGGALALFSQNVITRYAAAPGKSLSPISGSEGLLPAGTYNTIDRTVANMVAAVIPPAGSETLVQVVGVTGGTVSIEHSP